MSDERAVPVSVAARLDGWDVELRFEMPPARLGAALRRLGELGYEPRPAAPTAPPSKPKRPRATDFAPDGSPLCPTHGTAMREGEHGWYCPKKAKDGEPANPKGYCSAIAD